MAEDEASLYLLVVVAVVAVIGLGFAVASFATNESVNRMMGGGGMMNQSPTSSSSTPGALEWSILVISAAALALAVVLLFRGRPFQVRREATAAPSSGSAPMSTSAPMPPLAVEPQPPSAAPTPAPVPEPALVKLLDADEKRMYLELRDHGGEMYQRDIVALGTFSKAKVTRVLDKLEAKGLVVREAHGMTNRVRLVNLPAK